VILNVRALRRGIVYRMPKERERERKRERGREKERGSRQTREYAFRGIPGFETLTTQMFIRWVEYSLYVLSTLIHV